jgi:hypothetical protein
MSVPPLEVLEHPVRAAGAPASRATPATGRHGSSRFATAVVLVVLALGPLLVRVDAMPRTPTGSTPDAVASPVGRGPAAAAVTALVTAPAGQDPLAAVPADFPSLMGYAPVPVRMADGTRRLTKPTGACSVPGGGAPFRFHQACKVHDYGYDLLRYAHATGQPPDRGGAPTARRHVRSRPARPLPGHWARHRRCGLPSGGGAVHRRCLLQLLAPAPRQPRRGAAAGMGGGARDPGAGRAVPVAPSRSSPHRWPRHPCLNLLVVWTLVQQVGFFYADGTLSRLSRRALDVLRRPDALLDHADRLQADGDAEPAGGEAGRVGDLDGLLAGQGGEPVGRGESLGAVAGPLTTSIRAEEGTGLKKCMPTERSGRRRPAASSSIDRELVLVATTAAGPGAASTAGRTTPLRAGSSGTASMTAPRRPGRPRPRSRSARPAPRPVGGPASPGRPPGPGWRPPAVKDSGCSPLARPAGVEHDS